MAIRYIGIAFIVLAGVLILSSIVPYIQAEKIQEQYDEKVIGAYKRLELVGQLYENNIKNQNQLRAYVTTENNAVKDSLRIEIRKIHASDSIIVQQLDSLLISPERRQLLDSIKIDRNNYQGHIEHLLDLLNEGQVIEANTYAQVHLIPYYNRHQVQLTSLSESITASAQANTSEVFMDLSDIVGKNILFIFLALAAAIGGAVLHRKVIRHLQQENQLLISEVQERQELEQALFEKQNQYVSLFNSNPIPILVFDHFTFRILEVNDAAIQEFGYTHDEFINLTILDLKPHADREKLTQRIQALKPDEQTSDTDTRYMRKDGSVFETEIKTHALPPQDGVHPRLVAIVNVHEQVQAIKKLQQREQQLREISSSIPGAVYQFQVDQQGNFSFQFMSEGIFEMYGITPDDVYNNPDNIFKHLHPKDAEAVHHSIKEAVSTRTPWYCEARLWNPVEHSWKWIRGHSLPTLKENGTVVFNGTLIDITAEREAQEKLINHEANLQALLNSSPQAIYLLDEHLHVINYNKVAAEDIVRYGFPKLSEGQSMLSFSDNGILPELKEDHAIAMQGHEVVFETGNNGKWYEVAFRPAISSENKVVAVALSVQDITAQRTAIEAIRKSEAQLAKAQELAKIGSWEYDIESDKLKASESLKAIFELEDEQDVIDYRKIMRLHHPDDVEHAIHSFEQAVENRTEMAYDTRIILKDGRIKYLHIVGEVICNAEGAPVKVSGATQDVTELQLKEQEATRAKEQFKATLENIPEVIFSSDAQFNIQYVSPQVHEVTGYSEDEFVGAAEKWAKVVHPDDLPFLMDTVIPSLLAGKKMQFELRLITKSGEPKWGLFRQSPAFDSKGNVIRIDSSVVDITDRKKAEAKRALLTDQLQKQNQHLQQFAYIVSHNLRTPIANILGLVSVFRKDENTSAFNARVIENLEKSANNLDSTIKDMNEILTIRGQITDTFEEISFEEILQNILSSISQEINESNAKIEYNFSGVPTVNAIRSYVYSILQNLIVNALKYRSPERQPHIILTTFYQNGYVCLTVTDNGLGIDLEKQKRKVFGLYKRFHPQIEGKGIGLHLVKTQAELLGGKVEVESQVNVGTTFTIYFKR